MSETLNDVSPGFWQAVELLRAERDRILGKRMDKKAEARKRAARGHRAGRDETVLEEW